MAFNPFHGFRRHKKVIFAILTIICMFTFVLAGNFGKGDAFDTFLDKIGASNKRGKVVAELYGDKVYEGQLGERERRRTLANTFVRFHLETGRFGVTQDGQLFTTPGAQEMLGIMQRPGPASDTNRDIINFRNAISPVLMDLCAGAGLQFNSSPLKEIFDKNRDAINQYFEALGTRQQSPEERFERMRNQRERIATVRRQLASKSMDDEVKVLDAALTQLAYRLAEMTNPSRDNNETGYIFGGSRKRQDLLDFMVWLKQADTLGITFTSEDVRKALKALSPFKLMLTGNKGEDQTTLNNRQLFAREAAADLPTLYSALVDEFRVALAQGIILGQEPGILGQRPSVFREPLGITPGQYVGYHDEQRRSANVLLLPLPVREFIDPKSTPTPEQVKELYDRYGRKDTVPFSSLPGFKIPQKVKVQWIFDGKLAVSTLRAAAQIVPLGGFLNGIEDPRDPVYLERADRHLLSLLAAGNVPSLIQAAGHFTQAHNSLQTNFELPSLLADDPAGAFHRALNLRSAIASTIGNAGAAAVSGDPLLNALAAVQIASAGAGLYPVDKDQKIRAATYQDHLVKQERTKRARILGGLVGSSVSNPLTVITPWAWADSQHESFPDDKGAFKIDPPVLEKAVPLAAIKDQVSTLVRAELASKLRRQDLEDFQKKFREAKGDDKAARAVIDEYVKKMHLENSQGESSGDNDPFSLAKDPGLRALRDAIGGEKFEFAARVFTLPGVYQFQREESAQQRRPVVTQQGEYLFWLTKNEPAATPLLSEVREEVGRKWQEIEARKTTKTVAEKISEELKGKDATTVEAMFKDKLAKNPTWGNLIRLDDVVRQRQLPRTGAMDTFQYGPYLIQEHDIEYPAPGFVDALLNLKAGEAGVLKDRPESRYFVAYVVRSIAPPPLTTALDRDYRSIPWRQLSFQQQQEKQKTIMEELRRQAGKLDPYGRFELQPGISSDDSVSTNE